MTAGKATGRRGAARKLGRGSREQHLKKRRLTPGVILLSLIMIPGFSLTVFIPAQASADPQHICIACPNNPSECEPNCSGGGGGCPVGTVVVSVAVTKNNPTNSTLTVSFSGPGIANLSFFWGNTTNYGFSQYDNHTTTSWTIFLDYLNASKTYDYKAVAANGCWTTGTTTGSWTTSPESNYLNTVGPNIEGIVFGPNSGTRAPANIEVEVQCTRFAASHFWSTNGLTNSNGAYKVNVGVGQANQPECTSFGYGAFVVQAFNLPGQWNGHWNDTIVVWQPQVVNFYLPGVFVGPYVPQLLMFTSSAYVTLSYNTTVSVTTSYSAEVAGNGGTKVSTFIAQESGSTSGQPLENWVQFYTSGTVEYSALTRQSQIVNTSFYGAIQNSTTQDKASDPVSPSSVSASQCYDNGMWYNFNITRGNIRGGGVTISGSVTITSGLNIDVGLDFSIGGGVGVSASIPIEVTFSTTQSYSHGFYFNVDNTDSVQHVFRAYVQGGSDTETGIIVHVWQLS
jgi:hypothetical protein